MAGIEVNTGELVSKVYYKCTRCGKMLDHTKDMVRPWFTRGKKGLCHPVTYYSPFLGEDDTYLCGNVIKLFHR